MEGVLFPYFTGLQTTHVLFAYLSKIGFFLVKPFPTNHYFVSGVMESCFHINNAIKVNKRMNYINKLTRLLTVSNPLSSIQSPNRKIYDPRSIS